MLVTLNWYVNPKTIPNTVNGSRLPDDKWLLLKAKELNKICKHMEVRDQKDKLVWLEF